MTVAAYTNDELATTLVALRMLQEEHGSDAAVRKAMPDLFVGVAPSDATDIDKLCERSNSRGLDAFEPTAGELATTLGALDKFAETVAGFGDLPDRFADYFPRGWDNEVSPEYICERLQGLARGPVRG